MKKQQYVAAVACLVAGAIGFASVYATEKAQERKNAAEQIAKEQSVESTEQLSAASNELKTSSDEAAREQIKKAKVAETSKENQNQTKTEEKPKTQEKKEVAVVAESLHFNADKGIAWPIEGEILLDYSMDKTIYFPTLEQYRCNPALVIEGAVNDKVFSVTRGKITEISENEVTGCTVKQDLGDGYTAIYGQLKELNFKKGDIVEAGQVIGYISEPTKYYSTEGSNLYFELQKDGKPINPKELLPGQVMDTLD